MSRVICISKPESAYLNSLIIPIKNIYETRGEFFYSEPMVLYNNITTQ